MIAKADRALLAYLTQRVRLWIERHDHKKHAIDFMIRFQWMQLGALIVWVIVVPVAYYLLEGKGVLAVSHAVIWTAVGVMEWFGIRHTIQHLKPIHDLFWRMRENPAVVEAIRETLTEHFEETRRHRLQFAAFMIGTTLALYLLMQLVDGMPLTFVWQYLFANSVADAIRRYLLYVNDMDPPKRRRKASKAISELAQRLWAEVVGGFAPQPV